MRLNHIKYELLKPFVVIFLSIFLIIYSFSVGNSANSHREKVELKIVDSTACEELGEVLFSDIRFSSPEGKLSGLKKDQNSQFQLSCKSCHMVDEKLNEKGMRGYTDFSKRTPVPFRNGDENPYQFTHRRTQQMINVAGKNISSTSAYHWDGEFESENEHDALLKLIAKTFVSRNMGWRDGEEGKANTLRLRFILDESKTAAGNDEEPKPTYIEYYCKAFGLTKPEFFKLSGEEILHLCNEAIAIYVENIKSDIDSPYDIFLKENGVENPNETDINFLKEFLKKKDFKFVSKVVPIFDSEIKTSRKVKFKKKELDGLKLFMNKSKTNCSGCHVPPAFTDNKFYNIGVSEYDYRDVHGKFPVDFYTIENLKNIIYSSDIRSLRKQFQTYPAKTNICSIDLGRALFTNDLEKNIAAFRTPTLRNLEYNSPYLHSGRAETIKEAILFHISSSDMKAKLNFLSNELIEINLSDEEIECIVSFLNSLNDHYE